MDSFGSLPKDNPPPRAYSFQGSVGAGFLHYLSNAEAAVAHVGGSHVRDACNMISVLPERLEKEPSSCVSHTAVVILEGGGRPFLPSTN